MTPPTITVAVPLDSLAVLADVIACARGIADDAPARKRTKASTTAEVRWTSVLWLRESLAALDADPVLAAVATAFDRRP